MDKAYLVFVWSFEVGGVCIACNDSSFFEVRKASDPFMFLLFFSVASHCLLSVPDLDGHEERSLAFLKRTGPTSHAIYRTTTVRNLSDRAFLSSKTRSRVIHLPAGLAVALNELTGDKDRTARREARDTFAESSRSVPPSASHSCCGC